MSPRERSLILASSYVINPWPTAVRPESLSRSGVPLPIQVELFQFGVHYASRPQRAFNYALRPASRGWPNPRLLGVVS
jgi:hypothetical protein